MWNEKRRIQSHAKWQQRIKWILSFLICLFLSFARRPLILNTAKNTQIKVTKQRSKMYRKNGNENLWWWQWMRRDIIKFDVRVKIEQEIRDANSSFDNEKYRKLNKTKEFYSFNFPLSTFGNKFSSCIFLFTWGHKIHTKEYKNCKRIRKCVINLIKLKLVSNPC